MDKNKKPVIEEFSILNLSGFLSEPDENCNYYRFHVRYSPKNIKAEGIYKIPDLSKDNIYTKIFIEKKKFNGIDSIDRCKALVKSIINTKDFCVEKFDELESDIVKDRHLLIASLSDKSKYAITLEMQNYNYNGINLNALIYGNELKKKQIYLF